MEAHADLKKALGGDAGRRFIEQLTKNAVRDAVIPHPNDLKYRALTEFTIRYDTSKGRKKSFRMDAYIVVIPGILAMRNRNYYTVAMEIKGAAPDLEQDNKMLAYLGWSDFFFLAVPQHLVEDAVAKVTAYDNKAMGVVNLTTGEIVIMPMRMLVSPVRSESRWVAVASYLMTSQDIVLYPSREQVMGLDESEYEDDSEPTAEDNEQPQLVPAATLPPTANEVDLVPEGVSEEERKARAERKASRIESAAQAIGLATRHQAWALQKIEPTAQAVWAHIARHEDEYEDKAVNSKDIRTAMDLSLAQISKYIYILSKAGLVERVGDTKPALYRRRDPDLNIKDDDCLDCDFFATAFGCDDPTKCKKGDCNSQCKDCDEKKVTTKSKSANIEGQMTIFDML